MRLVGCGPACSNRQEANSKMATLVIGD